MELIKEALTNVMQSLEKKRAQKGASPEDYLEQVFNKKELKHVQLKYFKKGVFAVQVDSTAWLYQLNLRKKEYLTQLNKKDASIKNIRFCLGGIK